jgi:hypothetical protein
VALQNCLEHYIPVALQASPNITHKNSQNFYRKIRQKIRLSTWQHIYRYISDTWVLLLISNQLPEKWKPRLRSATISERKGRPSALPKLHGRTFSSSITALIQRHQAFKTQISQLNLASFQSTSYSFASLSQSPAQGIENFGLRLGLQPRGANRSR